MNEDAPDLIDTDTAALFRAIDARDGAAFAAFLTDDAVFRFGSAPPVEGRDAIRASVEAFFGSIAGLSHRVTTVVRDGATLFCEGEVTYERHDGSTISLPFADVFDYEGDLIRHYKIYMDVTPLFAS
ncbi:MAG: nuclear transport factor 2 family protein [Gammaproteobacteria bacterium]|nr:nuclear transport factor 2 family protein [Gammaproteobacteria bacterium]MBT8104510.1 nuclear transport factor 2 family protein [Gammaproteobacteria bacterium]NNF49894.1 nuclear transport factor 2 family protein [Woeseiaceae bacterium]NNK24524.1 nuclear transport factor 2 family protein [Woeseiaceae bacterium]NNL64281.1 nuclear transport factor 2 family protein [Woeseiaceae bacterium]